jgi:single-strand DNA-binding protein
MNKIIIMGRLTKDPELRYTNTSQIPVVSFSLAVNRRYSKDKEQQVDFINVVAWQTTAEFVERNFTKGQPMCVEGRLHQRSWTDNHGNTRYAYEVMADNVHFAGFKRDDARNGAGSGSGADHDADFDPYADAA